MSERESVAVLRECIQLQERKAADYQNPKSTVKQADHYRRGVDTIHDMVHQKLLRAQSLLESGDTPKNEALEDTYMDMINYCSFAVAYLRGKIEGQTATRDSFNRFEPLMMPDGPDIYDEKGPKGAQGVSSPVGTEKFVRKRKDDPQESIRDKLDGLVDEVKAQTNASH